MSNDVWQTVGTDSGGDMGGIRFGAVITAAGMSTRMEDFKQLMKIGNMTMTERIVSSFHQAGIREIVVVTGCRADDVERSLAKRGLAFLRNQNYETTEMFDSAKLGLNYLKDQCDRLFFCPADVPFFSVETIRALMRRRESLVFPVTGGKRGHPILIDAKIIPQILEYQGEGGLGGALRACGASFCEVNASDEGSLIDADTKEDYGKLVAFHNRHLLHAEAQPELVGTKSWFGAGSVVLLKQIERLGSVREACEKTGISYSKGWKILRNAEGEAGFRIVERQAGGKDGGGAQLTEKGKKLIALYEQLEAETKQAVDRIYGQIFLESDLF